MFRSLAAVALSAALVATAAAPGPAWAEDRQQERASEPQIGALVFSLTAFTIFALMARDAVKDRDDDDDDRRARDHARDNGRWANPQVPPPQARNRQDPPRQGRPFSHPDPYALPARCLNRIETHDGPVRLYTQRCLRDAGVSVAGLPQNCHRRIRASGGQIRQGFSIRCMERLGFYPVGRR